eukprot:COSAG02_NODE_53409_length_302_cov_0.709360_1_plen_22_part_01
MMVCRTIVVDIAVVAVPSAKLI